MSSPEPAAATCTCDDNAVVDEILRMTETSLVDPQNTRSPAASLNQIVAWVLEESGYAARQVPIAIDAATAETIAYALALSCPAGPDEFSPQTERFIDIWNRPRNS